MVEKKGLLENMLNSNYFEVQKKEMEIEEKSVVLLDDFSKNIETHEKTLIKEQKKIVKQKIAIKIKYKSNFESVNADHIEHLDEIVINSKKIQEINKEELEHAKAKEEDEIKKLNESIDEINIKYNKNVESIINKYEKDAEKCNKEKAKINKRIGTEIEKLNEKLSNAIEKHLEKVTTHNVKGEERILKITEKSSKDIAKIDEDIVKGEAKIVKSIEDLKLVFVDRLADIEAKIVEENSQFDTKYEAIKSTLEAKAARLEKFMSKNNTTDDPKALKKHKKEVAILQKDKDKQLKLITSEHNDKFKVFDSNRKVLVKENLESNVALSKMLIQFREEKLYQIEIYKVVLTSDIEAVNMATNEKIQDEINKINEIERDHLIKVASVVLKQEVELEEEDNNQSILKISFNKENSVDKLKNEKSIAIIEKDLKIVKENDDFNSKSSNLYEAIEHAKLDYERKVSEKELVLNIKVNDENEIMEYYNLDFITQGLMSTENLSYQEDIKTLIESRADALLDFEVLEINNRKRIKVKFFEKQIPKLESDKLAVEEKINSAFELEQVLYDNEREKASSKDLEELKIYEQEANQVIINITEKRNTLDLKAYKKEIKELDHEIKTRRSELSNYVFTKRESITANTVLFDKGIEEVNDRKEKAINESELFFDKELSRIKLAIDIVIANCNEEIYDANDRHLKTFERTSLLLQNAQLKNNQLIEETTTYKMSRIQNENDVIKDFKDIFEKQKYSLNKLLDEVLSDYNNQIKSASNTNKDNISSAEEELQAKVTGFNKQLKGIESTHTNNLNKQASVHKSNITRTENKESNMIKKAQVEFSIKENEYNAKISEIEKASRDEDKKLESTKKAAKKDYELALSRHLKELSSKLNKDIKTM